MRLARYLDGERQCYGVLADCKVVCLPTLAERLGRKLPDRLEDFMALGPDGIRIAEELVESASEGDVDMFSSPVEDVLFKAPIAFPPKIICLGLNYRDHIAEQNQAVPDEPVIFMKPHTAIVGPNENIVKPSFVRQLDYEAELTIVIGRRGKNIPLSDATSHIFGYTIMNDVSARDVQFKDRQWTRGKSFDTFAPTGPCVTTSDVIQDTSNLTIRTWVNQELRQNSSTENMVFSVAEIVQHLSRVMTLEPCDLIATGTPSGVGFALKPQPKFLRANDVVRIEIERIGILQNTIVEY